VNTFRVVQAQGFNDSGFAEFFPVLCVVNQNDEVYATFWATKDGEIQALNYINDLDPTMPPRVGSGRVKDGIYLK
jgi:hypothetical protein